MALLTDTKEEAYPLIPLALLERLERDHLIPVDLSSPEGVLREHMGKLRLVRSLRLRYEEAANPEE